MKSILILGSNGFIGRHLVKYFISKKLKVYGCDLIEYYSSEFQYKKISILSSDFESYIHNLKLDFCINASGSGNVGYSMENPHSDFEFNVITIAKLLDVIRKSNPYCKYLHISSAAVYGNPKVLPIYEYTELQPISPYGFHKRISEIVCNEYHDLFHLPISIIRPFSVFGEGLRKQLLWDICCKLTESDQIVLHGTGKETRDFIHINDLVLAIDCIVNKDDFKCNVYNIASGIETTIESIANIIVKNFPGDKIVRFSGDIKSGDPLNWRADITRIKKIGFNSKSQLEKSIAKYVQWFLNSQHEG